MNILRKTIVSFVLLVLIAPESPIFAWTLTESVNSIQATDPVLPTGVSNPKGSIGALLAELFWGMGDGVKNGKIKPQYIDYSGISAWTQSGSEVFTSGTGNVGIGVSNPSAKLEVAGQVKITGGSPGVGKVLVSDASGLASWSASAPLYSFSETDPVWNGVSGNYYTKTNLQTSGQSSVHWGNLTNTVVANGFAPGILSVADWNTFNGKQNALGYTPAKTDGTNATGTWRIGISGNAATATNLSTNRSTWNTNGTISAVVGQLSWKNFGNGHTIFDASKSTSPDGTAVNNSNAAIAWTPTYPTLMGWNGTSTYGVRVDSARVSDSVAWAGISGTPGFATNAVSGRVRAYEVGCESGWGSSCDANTNGRIDNSDNSATVGGLGIGSLRQFNVWQNSHYSGTDGAEYATIFYDTDNGGYYVNPNGTSNINGLVVGGGISDSAGTRIDAGGGWMRTYGDTGWYNGTYAGGWYMTDATWIRAYNSKSVYSPGEVQATTIRGNSNLCIGGDCRAAWPAAGGISTTTTVNCSQGGYSGGGSYDTSCTATCTAGWYRTGCVIQTGYSTSVSTNGCSFRASNQTVQGTAICAK